MIQTILKKWRLSHLMLNGIITKEIDEERTQHFHKKKRYVTTWRDSVAREEETDKCCFNDWRGRSQFQGQMTRSTRSVVERVNIKPVNSFGKFKKKHAHILIFTHLRMCARIISHCKHLMCSLVCVSVFVMANEF